MLPAGEEEDGAEAGSSEEEGDSEGEEGGSGDELEAGSESDEEEPGPGSEEEEEQQAERPRQQEATAAAALAAKPQERQEQRQEEQQEQEGAVGAELPFTPALPDSYEVFAQMAQVKVLHAAPQRAQHAQRARACARGCIAVRRRHVAEHAQRVQLHAGVPQELSSAHPALGTLPRCRLSCAGWALVVIPAPALQGLPAADLGELVRRIRAYNAPLLTTEHRKRLQLLYGILVQVGRYSSSTAVQQ